MINNKNKNKVRSEMQYGFILVEFMIAFFILSITTIFLTQSFLFTIASYNQAKKRLDALHFTRNYLESLWIGQRFLKEDKQFSPLLKPIKHVHRLPHKCSMYQQAIEPISNQVPSSSLCIIYGWLKER